MPIQPPTPAGTSEKVLQTCFYAFNQSGYAAVSMDQIAKELKISKKTIYKLFPSKEFILESGIMEVLTMIEQKMAETMAPSPGRSTLNEIAGLYLRYRELITPRLREEIREVLPHLDDRIILFESQIFKKNLITVLKLGRDDKSMQYPAPTRETALVILRFLDGILESPASFREWAYKSLFKGFCEKSKKKKTK